MTPFEGVLRPGVIKPVPVDHLEALGRVAVGALRAHRPLVRVGVAVLAAGKRHRLVDGHEMALAVRLRIEPGVEVALVALHLGVFVGERVRRGVVVEAGGRGPPGQVVAGGAVLAQRAAVDVLVAGGAGVASPV